MSLIYQQTERYGILPETVLRLSVTSNKAKISDIDDQAQFTRKQIGDLHTSRLKRFVSMKSNKLRKYLDEKHVF